MAAVGRVIFMCGSAGSGKSTGTRRYEREGMTRLSLDQEAWARGVTAMPSGSARHGGVISGAARSAQFTPFLMPAAPHRLEG